MRKNPHSPRNNIQHYFLILKERRNVIVVVGIGKVDKKIGSSYPCFPRGLFPYFADNKELIFISLNRFSTSGENLSGAVFGNEVSVENHPKRPELKKEKGACISRKNSAIGNFSQRKKRFFSEVIHRKTPPSPKEKHKRMIFK